MSVRAYAPSNTVIIWSDRLLKKIFTADAAVNKETAAISLLNGEEFMFSNALHDLIGVPRWVKDITSATAIRAVMVMYPAVMPPVYSVAESDAATVTRNENKTRLHSPDVRSREDDFFMASSPSSEGNIFGRASGPLPLSVNEGVMSVSGIRGEEFTNTSLSLNLRAPVGQAAVQAGSMPLPVRSRQ